MEHGERNRLLGVLDTGGIPPESLTDGRHQYVIPDDHSRAVELQEGTRFVVEVGDSPAMAVVAGAEVPQVSADWLVVQPEVVARSWRRGWAPLGGVWSDELNLATEEGLEIAGVPTDATVSLFHSRGRFEIEKSGRGFRVAIIVG